MLTIQHFRFAAGLSLGCLLAFNLSAQDQHGLAIKNWAAPLYFQPPAGDAMERTKAGEPRYASAASPAHDATSYSAPLVFVAITPCRIVDTRYAWFPAPYGPPALSPLTTRTFPIGGQCGIPSTAQAYSLNAMVWPGGATTGGLPVRWLTMWAAGEPMPLASTLNDYQGYAQANAAVVAAGTGGAISVWVNSAYLVDFVLDTNGYYVAPSALALGAGTAGAPALTFTKDANSGLYSPGAGVISVVANGTERMHADSTGIGVTGDIDLTGGLTKGGLKLLQADSTSTGAGLGALGSNLTGSNNTAVGAGALANNTSGSGNLALGAYAGTNYDTGSYNIAIGNPGAAAESNTTRIGASLYQTRTFISGIRGVTTGNSGAVNVVIDSNGQLGTVSSSRRVKRDITDMGDTTATVMGLHPVRFRYKEHGPDAPAQYGLVAEEVAEVAPELVAHDAQGEIETVFYDKVNAMLLNEVQKQHRLIEAQNEIIRRLEARLSDLETREK